MEDKRQSQFRNVLIVEDDLSQQPLWQHIILRSCKEAKLTWAVSAEQALTIMKESNLSSQLSSNSPEDKDIAKFDLIVVDLFLAGSQTGLDFLNSIVGRSVSRSLCAKAHFYSRNHAMQKTQLKKSGRNSLHIMCGLKIENATRLKVFS